MSGTWEAETKFAKMGIPGLDEILPGGLPAKRLYVVEGMPETGKATLAPHFPLEGRRLGERVPYMTLSETKEELLAEAVRAALNRSRASTACEKVDALRATET